MIPWSRGRCMAWDVTVVDTLAPSHVTDSSSSAGSAAAKAEGIKTAKYASLAQTHVFIPLALETMGAWGQQCTDFVTDLGRRLTAVSGEKREPSFLRQRISMAVQRGNALACRGTLPTDSLTDHSSLLSKPILLPAGLPAVLLYSPLFSVYSSFFYYSFFFLLLSVLYLLAIWPIS